MELGLSNFGLYLIQYMNQKGIPTPYLIREEGLSLETIEEDNMKDENMYVVVHAASQWLTLDTLEAEFSASFLLGEVNQYLYIVDVKSIIAPLFMVANASDSTKVCMLPQKNGKVP